MAQDLVSEADEFGSRLSIALKVLNLSRSQFSAALGVHKSLVSRWLSGQVQPTSYNLARISALFAKLRPGFNMTLWAAPRADFEAALGMPTAAATPIAETLKAPTAKQITPAAPFRRQVDWRWSYTLPALAVLLLIAFGSWMLGRVEQRPAQRNPSPPAPTAASVAVMPFVNMSGDPAKNYLGDGIAEEILNDLANTPKLRVASRTSSFSFRSGQADIGEIARKLNVGAVLEGSVRQEGNRVRIVAQLIDGKDGFHLWSARYDRRLDDVLSVQDEIASAITVALDRKLISSHTRAQSTLKRKIDPNAYTAFLKGRYEMHKAGTSDFLRATGFFKQAIHLQPDYIEAHAMLALTYLVLFTDGQRRDALQPAEQEAAIALRLAPDDFWALLAKAQIDRLHRRWIDAEVAMQKLLKRRPNSAEGHHFQAVLFEGLGLWAKSVAEQRRAAELDPLVPAYRDNIGQALHSLRRDDEARLEFENVLRLEPNFVMSLGNLCTNYADAERLSDAKRILQRQLIPLYAEDPNRMMCEVTIAYREHDRKRLQAMLQFAHLLYASGALGASYLPFPYAYAGDYDDAVRWLEKAYDDDDYGVFYVIDDPDLPSAIRSTARWRAFMQRPAFHERAKAREEILRRNISG